MKSALSLLILLAGVANAQDLRRLQVDAAPGKVGQPVSVTVEFGDSGTANCGMRLNWGDGTGDDVKINDLNMLPFKAVHVYAQPGDYTIAAEPKKVTSHLPCIGKAVKGTVRIAAEPKPVVAPVVPAPASPASTVPAPAVPAASASNLSRPVSPCPDGWRLDPRSQNRKTGAFTCTAKPGTALPEKKLNCPGDLSYIENRKKGWLGCRP